MPPNSIIRPPRTPNTRWNHDEIASLITQLKQAKDKGNTSENGFKATIWTGISSSFEDTLKTGRACETKQSRMKKDYKEVKFLREASGFGWDKEYCLLTAEYLIWVEI